MPKQAMIDFMQKAKNDNLYTPYESIYPLLKYIPENIKTIWECCDFGESKITEILKRGGYNVLSSDIIHGFDFLKDKPDFDFDMIITNPPYSLKDDFLRKCYNYNKPFALLLPLTAFEGKARHEMYREHGISAILFDGRADFTGKHTNWFNTSWFCWKILENNTHVYEKLISP